MAGSVREFHKRTQMKCPFPIGKGFFIVSFLLFSQTEELQQLSFAK